MNQEDVSRSQGVKKTKKHVGHVCHQIKPNRLPMSGQNCSDLTVYTSTKDFSLLKDIFITKLFFELFFEKFIKLFIKLIF